MCEATYTYLKLPQFALYVLSWILWCILFKRSYIFYCFFQLYSRVAFPTPQNPTRQDSSKRGMNLLLLDMVWGQCKYIAEEII